MSDRVEREVVLLASREQVWEALTKGEHLAAWFGARATIDRRPGGRVEFAWNDGTIREALIEGLTPRRRFAFRWLEPGGGSRVEFLLTETEEGTLLTVVETALSSALERPEPLLSGRYT